jgi:serine/threonine protein kinase
LDQACRNDDALRREVESLLAHHDRSGPFLGVYSSIGNKIPAHYEVLELIAAGGMGQVYKARDIDLDRVVAIKSLPPWAMGNPRSRKQLIEEARSASGAQSP